MNTDKQFAGDPLNWFLRNFQYNIRLSGWLPILFGVLVLAGFLVWFTVTDASLVYLRRATEVIIPLAFGLHAAFVFAPENEPAMEVLLSCPVPTSRLLARRLLTIGVLFGSTALFSSLLISFGWNAESLWISLMRWLATGMILGGVAVSPLSLPVRQLSVHL